MAFRASSIAAVFHVTAPNSGRFSTLSWRFPDLSAAQYEIWTRGRGLVDSSKRRSGCMRNLVGVTAAIDSGREKCNQSAKLALWSPAAAAQIDRSVVEESSGI